jgi:hypothetical protein
MTTQTAQIHTFDYGASLSSATLRNIADDTLVATADSVNEVTADSGLYAAVFDEASVIAAGTYRLRAVISGQPINRYVTLAGTDNEVVQSRSERLAELDSATRVKLDATQPDYAPATAAALAAAKTILDKVDSGLVADGPVFQFTANMLELGPSGTSVVTVLPATGIVANRSAGVTLLPVIGETISQAITVYQSDGTTAVNLSGKTLNIIFETMSGADVAVVQAADITISGTSSNVVTFAYPSTVTASERTLRFAIRDASAPKTMYLQGVCSVVRAPQVDA